MIDPKKGSAYLRHKRSITGMTYAAVMDISSVPNATISAYFNGTPKSFKPETFESLVLAVGGTMEEYERWSPPAQESEENDMKIQEILDTVQRAFDACTAHMETAYNGTIAAMEKAHATEINRMQKEHGRDRIEKYVLFGVLLLVAAYAVFAFTHYDLPDPTSGVTSLFQ